MIASEANRPAKVSTNGRGSRFIEKLEDRAHFSVSIGADGFTVVKPATDSLVIYVSNSTGSDSNNGLSASAPVKTLAKGVSLIRDGKPDQMLLKRGDQWFGGFGYWKKSGRSVDEPMVLGAYGEGNRPEIRSGTGTPIFLGSIAAKQINYFSILGIRFYANGRDPAAGGVISSTNPVGIGIISGTKNVLIEDCRVERYQANINFVPVYGRAVDTTIRRCEIVDAYSTTGIGAHGVFADGTNGLTLDQNLFDHNGWIEGATKSNIFSHNAYVTGDSNGLVARGNIFANASSHGIQARAGGIIDNNLFVNDPLGLSFGVVNAGGAVVAGGVSGRIQGNVFIGSRDIGGVGRGIAMEIGNIKAGMGTAICDNVISTYTAGAMWAIQLGFSNGTYDYKSVGINDLMIEQNTVYKWFKGVFVQFGMSTSVAGNKHLGPVTIRNNTFAEIPSTLFVNAAGVTIANTGKQTRAQLIANGTWSDPDRSIASYTASIGAGVKQTDFFDKARSLQGGIWDAAFSAAPVIDYIRAGFGMTALTPMFRR